jgi:WD40 repeat protein
MLFQKSSTEKKCMNIQSHIPIAIGSALRQMLRINLHPDNYREQLNKASIAGYMKLLLVFLLLNNQMIHAQQAELVVQISHVERISCLATNKDGSLLASGSEDHVVKLWNVQSGLLIRSFYGLRQGVRGICFSDDGKQIMAGDYEGHFVAWDLKGNTVFKTQIDKDINSISKANTSNKAIITSKNNVLEMDLGTKKTTILLSNLETEIAHAVYSNDDKMIALCRNWSNKDNIGLYKNGKLVWYNMGSSANRIAFSTNNEKIVWSAGGYGAGDYGMLDIKTGKVDWKVESKQDKGGHEGIIAISNDVLIVGSARKGMITVHSKDGSQIKAFDLQPSSLSSLLLKDGYVFSAGSDRSIIKWDAQTLMPVMNIGNKSDYIWDISLAKDGKTLAAACGTLGKEQSIKIWDISTGRYIKRLNDLSSDNDIISTCEFAPNQKYIAAGTESGKLVYWEYPETRNATNYHVGNKSIRSIAFHPRSNYVTGVSTDGQIITQRVRTNNAKAIEANKGMNSVCFSPDGDLMLVGRMDGVTELWDFNTKTKIKQWETHKNVGNFFDTATFVPYGSVFNIGITGDSKKDGTYSSSVSHVAWSSDGKTIGAAGAGRIAWIDARTRMILGTNEGLNGVCQFAFSPDNNSVAFGCADHNIRIIDLITGSITKVFQGHENEVRSVQFTPDGKYLISGSLDSQIKIWELSTGKCLLSFITLTASNDFIIFSPEGYYLSSKGAGKVLAFRVGNEVYPFPQFDLKFNRPDIIVDILQKVFGTTDELAPLKDAYNKAYQKRLQKMNFTEEEVNTTDLHLPVLSIAKTVNNNSSVDVDIKATDSKYLLNRIQVYVDDVPLYGSKGIDLKSQKSKQSSQKINIPLMDGLNNIQLSCINEKGVESLRIPLNIVGKQDGKPNLYVIAISVSKYKDASMNLGYAVKDGKDMLHYFSSLKEQYNIVYTDSLFDENATIENIASLKNKLLKTNPNDAVIVFVSGHGMLDKDNSFYYATHDMDFANPSSRGLAFDNLENILDGIPARKKLLLIDACHSGEVDEESIDTSNTVTATSEGNIKTTGFRGVTIKTKKKAGLKNSFEMMQDLFTNLSQGSGALVISAAAGVGFALESAEWNNGLFTYAVLKTLKDKEGDANKNKHISVNELKANVTKEVERLSNGRQKPTTRRELLEWDWDLN